MTKTSIIAAIMLLACSYSASYAASGEYVPPKTVIIRSDLKIADKHGKIIGVPNPSDPRTSPYRKYYVNADKDCTAGCESDFYIIAGESGYERRELAPQQGDIQPQTQPANGLVTNYGDSVLIHDPNKGVYGGEPSMNPAY